MSSRPHLRPAAPYAAPPLAAARHQEPVHQSIAARLITMFRDRDAVAAGEYLAGLRADSGIDPWELAQACAAWAARQRGR